MAITLIKAKRRLSERYGFDIIEESALGKSNGDIVKGEARPPVTIAIRSDLEPTMKLIAMAHEAGHLINYNQTRKEHLHGGAVVVETTAWLNGLSIAIGFGILKEYTNYWKYHLGKTIKYSSENTS